MSNDTWFEDHDKLTEDQKKILFNELKKFDEYGDVVYQEEDLAEIAAKFDALTEYAKRYLNEKSSETFDQVTINRNMKELEKKVRKFKKEAKKTKKHQNRLTALYDDIGIIFDRYFGVGEKEESDTISESMNRDKKSLEDVIQEELSNILQERVEYDRRKMLDLMDRDSLISHVVKDRATNPDNPSDRVLRIVFNSYVIGDSAMERKYNG